MVSAKGLKLFCFKCHKKTATVDAKQVTMKNGRGAIQGKCPNCGTKQFQIGTLEK